MRIPKDSERQLFIGATGSGKTTLALHVLSHRNITSMPFVILNTKDDENINNIPHTYELDGLKLPKEKNMQAGIYIARPSMGDYDGIEDLMHEIWLRTHIGLFVDETLAISQPLHPAYRTLLTQGRSRRTPVDSLTQRPVNIDRYAFSESEHFYVMPLNSDREKQPIYEQTGWDMDMNKLRRFHAYKFYGPARSMGENPRSIIQPSPPIIDILDVFDRKLRREPRRSYFI